MSCDRWSGSCDKSCDVESLRHCLRVIGAFLPFSRHLLHTAHSPPSWPSRFRHRFGFTAAGSGSTGTSLATGSWGRDGRRNKSEGCKLTGFSPQELKSTYYMKYLNTVDFPPKKLHHQPRREDNLDKMAGHEVS